MADGSVPIVLSPEPFARTTTYVEAPAGCTVRTMLASAVSRGHLQLDDLSRTNVYVDGVRLDRDDALAMVLREGQVINVVVEPLGGGGGGKKEIGQILLTIAVIAVSMWVGGPAGPLQAWPMLARQVAAAAVLTAGQMAVAAIFKPESNVAKTNDRYALSAASNQYRQWGAMPLALGEVVVAPDLAVKTFTQSQGEDQWIYGILGLHYGPCTADDLKIGDTLVSSMGAEDVRVAYHLTPGPRTFSIVANDTDQLDLQEELQATVSGATAVVRAGSAEGELFEFDFFMPQGLYFAKDDGRKIAASVTVTIRYRPIDQNGVPTGSAAWQSGLTIPLTSSSSDPWRLTRSLALPMGRYEFEVRRSRLEDDSAKRKTDIGWTAVRAIAFRKPVADETLSLIEFAVRASALNQGNLAPLTCRITPICETWTGGAWGAPEPTSNPAAVARWLMTGPAPALPLASVQADVGLRTWAALCDQYDWAAHLYLTEDRKQDEVLQLLGMSGRASLFWDGTQLVASPWTEKPAPRQLFAGSNLKDHRWEIVFPDTVHALRVEFQNIEQGGEADEVYVYADGYAETADAAKGLEAATLVEALRIEGQQTLERAYRDGRWNLAARLHQRRVDSWSTDIEHIVCRFGDRVRLAWDRVGTANATVRNRVWSGGLVSGLRLSQPVRMEPGRAYALDLRLPGQVLTGVPVVNPATTEPVVTRTVAFADLRSANVSPRGGDLVAFGEPERISEDVEVIGITPGPDLTATLVGIRYVAPLLMAAETGPVPPLQSRLTRDRAMDPPAPTLLGWQANEEGVRIGFSMPPWRGSPVTGFTVRWRQTPQAGQSSPWVSLPDLPANAMTAVLPPLRELPAEATNVTSAQVQIAAVTADGRASVQSLQVTVYEQAIQQPPAGDWSVTPLTEAPDGSRQSGFLVIGLVGSVNPRRVTVEYGASADGPWDSAFDGPPVDGVVRAPILGMQAGSQCWIAITYWTAQAVAPSERRILGPYTAPDLIAGDVSPSAPTIVAMQDAIDAAETGIGSINTAVASLNATIYTAGTGLKARSDAMYADINTATTGLKARSDAMFADINTASTGLKAQTASLLASLNTPTTGVLARLTTVENSATSNNSAAVGRLNALEATVNTAGTGLTARMATAENAIVTNRDAAATRLSALEATVNTAGTGLSAKVSGLQSAVTDLQTGKANASDLSLLQTEVTTARGSAASLNARLNTVESNVAGKASSQSVTALESSVAVRNRTFRQTTAPTSPANGYPLIAGDRWINTTSGQNNAESAWSGSAWVSITDPRIAAADQGVTDLTAKIGSVSGTVADALAGKASAQALTDLTTRVTSAEGVNTAQNTRLSTVESDVAGKASSARVTALEATVNTAGTGLSARMATQETATANLQTNKADASRVTALEARSETVMAAAISLMPSTPAAELWTNQGTNGAPLSRPSLPASAVVNGAYVQASIAGPKQHLPWRDGAIFDLVSTVFNPNAGAASFRHHVQRFDASYQAVGGNAGSTTSVPAGVTTTITSRFGMGVAVAGGTQLTRSGAEWLSVNATNNLTSGAPLQVQSLAAADVTDATAISSVAARMATQEGAVADLQAGKADASRVTALEATVNTAGTGLSARVAGLQTAVGDLQTGKASASDLTALTARVTSAEGVNTAQNTRLTSAETEIGKRALATDVTALAARVTTAESDNSAQNTRLNTVESDVAGKASASSVADLQATLHTAGTGLLARMGTSENAIVNLQTGKADASRVTSLEATINTAGTGLSARLTNVESVAASADGTAKSIKGFVQDVNGYVSGFSSINNGLVAQIEFLADNFGIRSPGSGERTEYRAGNWYVYSPTEGTRTRYGKAFGGTQKLTWWAGPDTVAEGSETKANAYVYMSQNTVGGPRFGGSDVPVAGSGTAAAGRGAVSGSISNTTFATVASVTFTGRPASGFWTAAVSGLSASASGVDANMEFRVIEQGASTALASGFTVVPGGGATTLVDLSLSPAGLLAQTRPAGSITLNLQARRTAGSGAVTISGGDFNVTYTPSA